MHFKKKILDYLQMPQRLEASQGSVSIFYIKEPFFESFVVKKIKQKGSIFILGNELTISRLDNFFSSPDMFNQNGPAIVLNAESIESSVWEYFLSLISAQDSLSSLTLIFSRDSKGLLKKIPKKGNFDYYVLEEILSWDYPRLLIFLTNMFKVKLTTDAVELFLSVVSQSVANYFYHVGQIKMLLAMDAPDHSINSDALKPILTIGHIDQFALADLWSDKKIQAFYQDLVTLNCSYEEMAQVIQFTIGQMLKISNPDYINDKKGAFTKYDEKLQKYSLKWNKVDSLFGTGILKELLIKIRKKEPLVKHQLQLKSLGIGRKK